MSNRIPIGQAHLSIEELGKPDLREGPLATWNTRCRIPFHFDCSAPSVLSDEEKTERAKKKKKYMDAEDGDEVVLSDDKVMVEGYASSSSVDWYGTEMGREALDMMADQFRDGVPMLPRHPSLMGGGEWDDVMGRTIAGIVEDGPVEEAHPDADDHLRLRIVAELDTSREKVPQLLSRLREGEPIGWSIGGWFTRLRVQYNEDTDEVERIIVLGVDLDHHAFTRRPANPDAWITEIRSAVVRAIETRSPTPIVEETPDLDEPAPEARAEDPAPGYRPADPQPARRCGSCTHHMAGVDGSQPQTMCEQYSFQDDPDYVCDSWSASQRSEGDDDRLDTPAATGQDGLTEVDASEGASGEARNDSEPESPEPTDPPEERDMSDQDTQTTLDPRVDKLAESMEMLSTSVASIASAVAVLTERAAAPPAEAQPTPDNSELEAKVEALTQRAAVAEKRLLAMAEEPNRIGQLVRGGAPVFDGQSLIDHQVSRAKAEWGEGSPTATLIERHKDRMLLKAGDKLPQASEISEHLRSVLRAAFSEGHTPETWH